MFLLLTCFLYHLDHNMIKYSHLVPFWPHFGPCWTLFENPGVKNNPILGKIGQKKSFWAQISPRRRLPDMGKVYIFWFMNMYPTWINNWNNASIFGFGIKLIEAEQKGSVTKFSKKNGHHYQNCKMQHLNECFCS